MTLEHLERLMRTCLQLASRGRREVEPNPQVGCVILRDGEVIARGWHRHYGGPHAEIDALRQAGERAKGSTLCVNLEPCNHFGQTPPCTDAIIDAGIHRVVIGTMDPNPLVRGKGIATLHKAGIDCTVGVLERECKELNARFFINMLKNRCYVGMKIAQSLDGFIATRQGESKWITSEQSRKEAHRLRAQFDAVLVGAETLRKDNPALTVRYAKGKNPVRVILTSSFRLPVSSTVFNDGGATLIMTTREAMGKNLGLMKKLLKRGGEILAITERGNMTPKRVLATLFKRGYRSVLLEGGTQVFSNFLEVKLVDRLDLFLAPIFIGDGLSPFSGAPVSRLKKAFRLPQKTTSQIGEDIHIISHFLDE